VPAECLAAANRPVNLSCERITTANMKTFLLYVVTAIAEIVGCYFPYRWLKEDGSHLALILVRWRSHSSRGCWTLHASAAGRVYAAYGGVYIGVAIMWLWISRGFARQPGIWPAWRSHWPA